MSIEDDLCGQFAGKMTDKVGWRALIEKAKSDGNEKLAKFLKRMLGPGATDEDDDADLLLPASHGMDSRTGRRLVRPASAADRAMFEASIGIVSDGRRRIRNLGNN